MPALLFFLYIRMNLREILSDNSFYPKPRDAENT